MTDQTSRSAVEESTASPGVAKSEAPEQSHEPAEESYGEIIRVVIYALLIALAFRTVLFQPFSIPSGSMKPTLLIGDYLFVSKYAYGYSKHSLPYGNLLPDSVFGGRLFGATPERGDVIVFRNPNREGEDYIKRLIGLPGDAIRVRQGVLYVNEEPVALKRESSFIEPLERAVGREQACVRPAMFDQLRVSPEEQRLMAGPEGGDLCLKIQFEETLPNGVRHAVLDANGAFGALDNTKLFTVPEGHYFFMGDNRDNSLDSRDNIGFVPAQNLVGRAEIILLSSEGAFWQIWKWRSDRFLKWID